MKKLFIVTLILSGFAFSGFSAEVNPQILNAFKEKFAAPKVVEWKAVNDLVRAKFEVEGQVTFAFYREDGELIAVSRTIKAAELPATLSQKLNKKLDKFYVADMFTVTSNEETKFYAVICDGSTSITLEGFQNNWRTFKKERLSKLSF